MDQLEMLTNADICSKANAAFYRGVTGDWHDLKLVTVADYLRQEDFPPDIAAKTLIAIVEAQNAKHRILYDWQQRINKWHKEGKPELCANLGLQIAADIDEAIAPLAPFAIEIQSVELEEELT